MKMKQKQFGFLNKSIDQPLRYIGGELNSIQKQDCPANFLLAFPDVYEIGMSHFGSRILYEQINFNTPYSMERVYMPWKDAYSELKNKNIKLRSIETGKDFSDFDAVGFSLQHELCYTNVLAMLELGGLELFADKRNTGPIIIAGGGAVFNPAPMKSFIDVFAVGDGEELIIDIMEVLSRTKDRKERLKELSKVKGLYVPSIHSGEYIIERRILSDLNDSPVIKHPLVPYMELVHDRLTYEIQRGCNRGCRFCQAGIIYRPVRQRSADLILDNIEKDLKTTGYREVGVLSLNACDYPPLPSLVEMLQSSFRSRGIYLSLPSLRIESISSSFMNILSQLPKSGFTIAPEAGSKRLRAVINKNITEEEILNTVRLASELGWSNVKAYFMLGLPTETDDDIDELIELINKMRREIKNNKTNLVASFSNFVPKSHTPFQWERQITSDEFEKKLSKLKMTLRDKRIKLKWSDTRMSQVEGMLSRGDSRLGLVIHSAYKKGEIFSSWGSEFDHVKWAKALEENGLNIEEYLRNRDLDEKLPWGNISSGVDIEWLKNERTKAYDMKETDHCTFGGCSSCGVCSSSSVANKIAEDIDIKKSKVADAEPVSALKNEKKYRLRCLYKKTGRFIWLGHFDLMNAVEKALLRAKLPVAVSNGFKPGLQLSFSPPVGMGIECLAEIVDVFLYEKVDVTEFLTRINIQLPQELHLVRAEYIENSANSIHQGMQSVTWCAYINKKYAMPKLPINKDVEVDIQRKGEKKVLKLSDYLANISFRNSKDELIMDFDILFTNGKTLKPMEVLKFVLPDVQDEDVVFVRKEVVVDGIKFSN